MANYIYDMKVSTQWDDADGVWQSLILTLPTVQKRAVEGFLLLFLDVDWPHTGIIKTIQSSQSCNPLSL